MDFALVDFVEPLGDGARERGDELAAHGSIVEALRALLTDGPVTLTVRGASMQPRLGDGVRATLAPVRFPLPGDILVFHDLYGRLVSHRFLGLYLRKGRLRLLLKGDAAPGPDEGVTPGAVVGRLVTDVRFRERGRAVVDYCRHAVRRCRAA